MEYIKELVMDRSSIKLVTDYGFISLMQTPHESLNDLSGIVGDPSMYKLIWNIYSFVYCKEITVFIYFGIYISYMPRQNNS